MTADPRPLARSTVVVKAARPAAEADAPLNAPVTFAATYVAGGDLEYGRYDNPTWQAFEEALGELEGGRCLTLPAGRYSRVSRSSSTSGSGKYGSTSSSLPGVGVSRRLRYSSRSIRVMSL